MKVGGARASHYARDNSRENETFFRKKLRANIQIRTLSDLYSPKRTGFFTAFIAGKRYNKLIFALDPLGVNDVAPEEVMLMSHGTSDYGIWTALLILPKSIRRVWPLPNRITA